MRLKDEEFVPFAPDSIGPKNRINHEAEHCSGDSQSLSIWRNPDGTIGAKCYRCGATGRAGSKPSMFKKRTETKELQSFPEDVSSLYSEMPAECATYLAQKGITEAIAYHYGIGWSEKAGGLVFPVHNQFGYEQAQVKRFEGKVRYYSIHRGHRETMYSLLKEYEPAPICVIVEDLLSAVRIDLLDERYDAFALLGSELNDVGLSELVRNYDNFVVWLDNDNKIVNKKAGDLHHRLMLFGNCRKVSEQCEPKDITDIDIRNILDRKFQ